MTAICGSWRLDGAPVAGQECARMQAALTLYGRDRSGRFDPGFVALGIQLARLLPEDRFDRQPLIGCGGRLVLVADARINNRSELAASMGLSPRQTTNMCDADYILAAWEMWGEQGLEQLKGIFAFALWDDRDRILRLVRDPLGQRPLFYHQGPGRLMFASMVKGLHALPDVIRAPDVEQLRDHLALLPHSGSRSFFAGIDRVEPGGMLRFHADGRVETINWYDRTRNRSPRFNRAEDYVNAFRDLFDRAVADALRTDGTVACHLSAGRDSGLVTVTAAAQLARRGQRLAAYTHVPLPGAVLSSGPNRIGDEGPGAARTASLHDNIDHWLIDCAHRNIGDDFDSTFHYCEYPVLNPSNSLWDSEISRRAAARGDKVILTGQFGNMTVSVDGLERLPELLGRGRFLAWLRECLAVARTGRYSLRFLLAGSVLPFLSSDMISQLRRLRGHSTLGLGDYTGLRPDLIGSAAFQRHLAENGFDPHFRSRPSVHATRRMVLWRRDCLALHTKGVLAATGLDTRDPTGDLRLVEFLSAVPTDLFLRRGETAWLFKKAFGDRLPAETVAVRRKGKQSADWATRLQQDLPGLRAEIDRARHSATATDLIDLDGLSADADAFPALEGRLQTVQMENTYHLRMLRALSVSHFLRKLESGNH